MDMGFCIGTMFFSTLLKSLHRNRTHVVWDTAKTAMAPATQAGSTSQRAGRALAEPRLHRGLFGMGDLPEASLAWSMTLVG